MSDEIEIAIDSNETIVESELIIDVVNNNNIVDIESSEPDVVVTFKKQEYVITGDDMYIPLSYDEAPQWLKDTITNITDFSLNQKLTEIGALSSTLYGLIDELNVAKNTYTMSIINSAEIDERINARIETLNSSLSGSDATIVDLIATKATPTEASSLALNVLTASINDGAISSLVSNLQNAISTATSTLANNIDIVHSEMTGDFEATSDAVSGLQTYIGVSTDGGLTGTGLLSDVKILQKQNDGVIETNTGTWDVMIGIENPNNNTDNDQIDIAKEPYATWKSLDVISGNTENRSAHLGDVYIKYTNATEGYKTYDKAYKFIKVVPDSTSPYSTDSEGFTWAVITDTDAQNAYVAALNALDLADSKRRVFVSTPTLPYDVGDLWLVQSGAAIAGTVQGGRAIQAGDLLRCSETKTINGLYEHNDWIPADSYREGMNAIQADLNGWRTGAYASFVTNIQSQVDGKAETFYQNSVPTGRIKSTNVVANSTLDKYVGDLWKNTYAGTIGGYLGNNTEYVYTKTANGSNWNYDWTKMEVPDIVFDTIDTKKSIYSGNSVPIAIAPDVIEVNDMWITGSSVVAGYDKESIYVWSGTAWIKPLKYTDDSATVALQNGLINGTVSINLANATINGTKSLSSYVAEEIDKEVVVFSGTNHATQAGMKTNDIFIEKTTATGSSGIMVDVVNTYKYTGTVWVQISNNSNLTKLADLTDGKRTVYSGSALPANNAINPLRVNDLFIPTSTFTVSTITYTLNEMYRYTGSLWQKATRYDEIKSALSLQIDSKIETTYGGSNPPVANQTNVARDTRGGDYWYCDTAGSYVKGNIYKYVETVNGSNYNYTWTLSSDISKGAFDLADKKRIIFGNAGNSVPTTAQGLALSDIWIPSSSSGIYISGKVYKCTNLSPVTFAEVDYTNDEVVNCIIDGSTPLDPSVITIGDTSTTFLEYVQSEIDKKVAIYSGESAPVDGQPIGVASNDIYLWFTIASKVLANGTTQTYDVTRTYKYSGSAWVEVTTNSNITALADLADGKRTVFSGNSVPVGAVSRDVWIPSAANGSYLQGEIYQYNGTSWVLATRYSANIEAVRSSLQTQVDGKVDTYYQAAVPTGITAINNGDYWYCTADISTYKKGKVYKYVHSTTSWIETADVSRYAFDTADGKASIFSSTSVPSTGYKVNDMLIVVGSFSNGTTTFSDGVVLSSTATRASGFTASDWIKKINDTEDLDAFVSNIYTPAVSDLQSQIDGQISYYFYDSSLGQTSTSISGSNGWNTEVLKKEHHGDIAYDKSTSAGYYYDRITSSWILINSATNSGLIEALKAASLAKATADGKVSHMYGVYQSTSPATTGAYKYWLTKAKVLKVLEGASWVDFAISKLDTGDIVTVWDSGLKDEFKYYWNGNTWYSQVNGGLVAGSKAFTDLHTSLGALGTIVSGHTGQLSTVDSRISNGVATVDSKWQYNSNLIINGVSYNSGFGLSNSAGTGVGSEFWIDASKLKFTNSAKTGRAAPFTIDATGTTPEITFNGKVSFSNVNGANMSGSNLLYNSAPAIGFETKGWKADYNDTGLASSGILATGDPYRPSGAGSFFQTIPGTPAVGKVFDIRAVGAIPVIGGQFYEGSAYLNSHRCDSQIYVGWADSAGAVITYSMGSVVTQTNTTNVLSAWGRSKFIAQAPANAVSCYYYIRGTSTGEANPYVFVSMCYFGRASEGQSVFSNWSEGISAGATTTGELTNDAGFTTLGAVASQGYVLPAGVANAINTNTTTIHGSKLTTGSVGAAQINVNDLFSKNITYTGVITGGNVAGGGIIKSYNGNMIINLQAGSIYIA